MIKKLFSAAAVATTCVALLAGTQSRAEEWKFAIEEIPGSVMDHYAQEFKKRIEQATDGEVTVAIYPLGSLGSSTDIAEQTQDGVIQLAGLSVGNLGTIVPESQIFLLAYLFPDEREKINEILATSPTIYGPLAEVFSEKDLKLASIYSAGPQVWTTTHEVRTPEDLENFKMRVMVSPILVKAYEDLGASPTPVPFGEVYSALQLKQVDGQINPVTTIEDMKFYEVTDYMIWAGEQDLLNSVLASNDWYDSLSPERQQLLDETISDLHPFISELVVQLDAERLEAIKAAKPEMKFITLTPEERSAFRELAIETRGSISSIVGERGAAILNSLVAEIDE